MQSESFASRILSNIEFWGDRRSGRGGFGGRKIWFFTSRGAGKGSIRTEFVAHERVLPFWPAIANLSGTIL